MITYVTCATCDIQIPATTLHSHRKSAQHKNKSLKKLEEDGVHQMQQHSNQMLQVIG
jgi:hypothetical protein